MPLLTESRHRDLQCVYLDEHHPLKVLCTLELAAHERAAQGLLPNRRRSKGSRAPSIPRTVSCGCAAQSAACTLNPVPLLSLCKEPASPAARASSRRGSMARSSSALSTDDSASNRSGDSGEPRNDQPSESAGGLQVLGGDDFNLGGSEEDMFKTPPTANKARRNSHIASSTSSGQASVSCSATCSFPRVYDDTDLVLSFPILF